MKEKDKQIGKEDELDEKKLVHFKSPPKDSEPDTTRVGDDTPPATTQGYAEKNVKRNPVDKPNAKN